MRKLTLVLGLLAAMVVSMSATALAGGCHHGRVVYRAPVVYAPAVRAYRPVYAAPYYAAPYAYPASGFSVATPNFSFWLGR